MINLKFKIAFIFICLFFLRINAWAQDESLGNGPQKSAITFDAGQVVSNFKFIDSLDNKDNGYKPNYTGTYSIGYNYYTNMGVFIRSGIGMRGAGATLVYDGMNYVWDLRYLDIRAGVGYLYSGTKVKPYLSVSGYFGFLLKANQILNNENFDMLNDKTIQKNDFGILITPGALLKVTDKLSLFSEFNYLMGIKNLETDTNGQKSKNKALIFNIGVIYNF